MLKCEQSLRFKKYFFILLVFLLLPNFSFAYQDLADSKSNSERTLVITEVKPQGANVPSHLGEWIEIMNVSGEPLKMEDFCLLNNEDYIKEIQEGNKEPKNCFSNFELEPYGVVVVAYSGYWFLEDNGFSISEIENKIKEKEGDVLAEILQGMFFELKETGDSSIIDGAVLNLEAVSLSRFYLSDREGEIFLVRRSGEVVDSFSWKESDSEVSWQRVGYKGDSDFLSFAPSPFAFYPEIVKTKVVPGFKEVKIYFERFGGEVISEEITLEKDGRELQTQSFLNKENIKFEKLDEEAGYDLKIKACDEKGFCFTDSLKVETKKHYPLIKLNELYPAPLKNEEEFVEVYNPNKIEVDLSGWQLKDKAGHIFVLEGKISPFDLKVFYLSFALNNKEEKVLLLDPNGEQKDKVDWERAFKGFSFSRFGSIWEWTRKETPGKKNILAPRYLPVSVKKAKEMRDLVEIKAQVVVPANMFASSYFYMAQGDEALKVRTQRKMRLAFGSCYIWQGEMRQGAETYLKLEKFSPARKCGSIDFISLKDIGKEAKGKLVEIQDEIVSRKGGRFLRRTGIKLRAPFKISKGQTKVKGVLWQGRKYLSLFVCFPAWIHYLASDTGSAKALEVSELKSNKLDEHSEGINHGSTDQSSSKKPKTFSQTYGQIYGTHVLKLTDKRETLPNPSQLPKWFFLVYYFVLVIAGFVAKQSI